MRFTTTRRHQLRTKKPNMWRIATLLMVTALCFKSASVGAEPAHGIAMHGAPKHGPDFSHFTYVNPNAPKGGSYVMAHIGSFDSLNPLIVKGTPALGLREFVYESLMARAYDEPFSLYGLLAQSIETPPDRAWVAFTLRPEARFSDGRPVTVEDVIFTHEILRDLGRPNYRFYYSKVTKVEKTGPRTVRFTFNDEGDREMPLIMGLMPILPKHAHTRESFEKTTLEPPIGSGPYKVTGVKPGAGVVFTRNPDYWGRDLPANRGLFNFDEIRYDYFRDNNALFESFKKGLNHVLIETDPARWALSYKFPAARRGEVIKKHFDIAVPSGMSALVFNTRRDIFSDIRVREALGYMLDFTWINKTLYHGLYVRTKSFFDRSELASHGHPASTLERDFFNQFPDALTDDVLAGTYTPPLSDGSGRDRRNRRKALKLLNAAGYVLKNGRLVNGQTGKPFSFEILSANREQERLLLTFSTALKRIGITAHIRTVDAAQYQQRKTTFDFDMIQNIWFASLSPGNEQTFRWESKAADLEGTYNFPGVKNKAIDAAIQLLLAAKDREDFRSSVRALDRALMAGYYVIPLFHTPKQWVAHWSHLRHPKKTSLYGARFETWWSEKAGSSASKN